MSEFKITPKDWNIDGRVFKPGDRLIIVGGPRAEIQFVGLKGTKEAPIVITATEKVLIKRSGTGGRVVHFFNCDHIVFDGTDKKLIEITGGGHGVTLHDCSNHAKLGNLHIHHCGYSGIDITNYPTCDPKTWRGAYVMEDIFVENNLITDLTDGEAIYIGPSHYESSFPLKNCPSGVKTALEHDGKNIHVRNNTIRTVGADGIQVGGATGGGSITGNTVLDFGTKKVYGQSSGIQANPGSSLLIEHNIVNGGTNFGIIAQGRSSSCVRYNRVLNTDGGIMAATRETTDKGTLEIYNNTLVNIRGVGIQYYMPIEVDNNVIQITSGSIYKKDGGLGVLTKSGNFELIGNSEQLAIDASGVPTAASKIPAGVGWKDYVKPAPVITKEIGTVELITTDGIKEEWFLVSPSGKRKKIE